MDGHATETATKTAIRWKPLLVASAERSNPKWTKKLIECFFRVC